MINVVFTGAAAFAGRQVLREDLKAHVEKKGFKVQSSVQATTQFLIASRVDTVKAKSAKSRGMDVLDYTAFFAIVGLPESTGAAPNAYTDFVGA